MLEVFLLQPSAHSTGNGEKRNKNDYAGAADPHDVHGDKSVCAIAAQAWVGMKGRGKEMGRFI
jgi:hypothetical protein